MRVGNVMVMCVVIASGYFLTQGTKAGQADYTYDKPVTLSGTMRLITFPGPPNYAAVRLGDAPERCFLLHLRHPISVRASKAGGNEFDTDQNGVTDLQLATSGKTYAATRRLARRHAVVHVTGTLFGQHTGHHHTPVLLDVAAIKEAKPKRGSTR